jgi:hypothetical protein
MSLESRRPQVQRTRTARVTTALRFALLALVTTLDFTSLQACAQACVKRTQHPIMKQTRVARGKELG